VGPLFFPKRPCHIPGFQKLKRAPAEASAL
jgi:hypothetical protein